MARTPRIGPVTFFQLLAKYGSAAGALRAIPRIGSRKSATKIPDRADIEREWTETVGLGATILCASEDEFPARLSELAPPPPVLTVWGKIDLFSKRSVAIVGARQASAAGRKLARDISLDLSDAGFLVVSGLARGIDGEAHTAALSGGTAAVLAGGIDHIYPPQHADLYRKIIMDGVLVSENPLGQRATARDFPRRNRVITGLSEGVVVIEAAERSGSLISARTGLEQNREVMAVPGSPLDPRCTGSNRLLREGATLVRHAEDVIEALTPRLHPSIQSPPPPNYEPDTEDDVPDEQVEAVRAALSSFPIAISEIARCANISEPRCASILTELEISGIARTYAGGLASLAL